MSKRQFMKNYRLFFFTLTAVFIVSACQPLPPAPEPRSGGIKWQYEVSYKPGDEGSPAISGDGTIYLVADNKLHAIIDAGNEGQRKSRNWPFGGETKYDTFTRPGLQTRRINVSAIPVIAVDERVLVSATRNDHIWDDKNGDGVFDDIDEYISEYKHILYALSADGEIAWQVDDMRLIHPPAAAVDGTIYAIIDSSLYLNDPKLVKLSSSGNIKGEEVDLDFAGVVTASPGIDPEGYVYILGRTGAQQNDLYRVDLRSEDSNQWVVGEWHVELSGNVISSFAIDDEGTVYLGAGPYIQAIRADQSEKWKKWLNTTFESTPALGENGVLYVGATNAEMYALNANDGNQIWSHSTEGYSIASSPAIGGSNGRIYVGANDGKVWAFKSDGTGEAWFKHLGGHLPGSPAIARDGTLYIAALDGFLYALNTDASGLADSDWPMYRRNTYHTNSVQKIADTSTWKTVYSRVFTSASDLALIHQYRDEYLLDKSSVGRIYVQRLYQYSDEALGVLIDNPELMSEAQALMAKNRDVLTKVLQGKSAEINNTKAVLSFIDKMATHSKGQLKELLKDVKKDMQESRRLDKEFIGIKLR